jgi:hypothetical protein
MHFCRYTNNVTNLKGLIKLHTKSMSEARKGVAQGVTSSVTWEY